MTLTKAARPPASIEISPYNHEWPIQFEAEKRVLQRVLAHWLTGEIQHVGSTAVVGLSAKPVIDIMAPVASLCESEAAIAAAVLAGYGHHPYQAEIMHWFCKPSPYIRTHHLYLVPLGNQVWLERLAFRDMLRANQELSAEYVALKLRLATQFPNDREAYTQAKTPFVQRVLALSRTQGIAPSADLDISPVKPKVAI